MSKTSESAREGFDDDSGSPPLKSAIFTSCFYFRVINYLANFTRAVPLDQASNLKGPGISFIAGSSYLELVSGTTKNHLGHTMVRLLSPEHI